MGLGLGLLLLTWVLRDPITGLLVDFVQLPSKHGRVHLVGVRVRVRVKIRIRVRVRVRVWVRVTGLLVRVRVRVRVRA